eukprot:9139785-Pyramimonas_sp.AAC.1
MRLRLGRANLVHRRHQFSKHLQMYATSSTSAGLLLRRGLADVVVVTYIWHWQPCCCLLYTSDAADDTPCVDL